MYFSSFPFEVSAPEIVSAKLHLKNKGKPDKTAKLSLLLSLVYCLRIYRFSEKSPKFLRLFWVEIDFSGIFRDLTKFQTPTSAVFC